MKPKHIEFFDDLLESVLTTLKVILLSKFFIKKPRKLTDHQDCVLLGNGPSLKPFLQDHLDFLKDKAVFCVNNFVRTQAFPLVRPEYYVIVAPDYWIKEEKPVWKEERYKIFHELAEKTDWDLLLFVPALAKKHQDWKKILSQNPKIRIAYFNNTPVEGLRFLSHFYFRKWLGMPRPHNVLVGTITIALNMGFKNCYITGADHSWLQEIIVADDNRVYLSQKHFYDDQLKSKTYTDEARPMYVSGTNRERRLHEILYKFYYSFRSYWELKDYATELGTQIYNLTPGSYIDAFERKTLPLTHGQSATS
jgi:hypothetical protein